MKIAVNVSSLSKQYRDILLTLTQRKSSDTFLFIFDKESASVFPENVTSVVLEAKGTAIGQRLYQIKLAALLKKNKTDIFISQKLISLKTAIPQLSISPDLSFIYQPEFFDKKQLIFYQKNMPLFLNKSAKIIVSSDFLKNEIIEKYKIDSQKVQVIYPEIKNDFGEIDFDHRELIKEKFAEGNEYFVYSGKIGMHQNLLNLLKAFSFFKKRQKSKMQLLIVGKPGIQFKEFMEILRLFRFRNEVNVLENLSEQETVRIVASAYAMIYVPFYETNAITALQAMKCHIPLVLSSFGSLKEFFNGAALYADAKNHKDIAEKMMLLFKNEHLRKELITKGESEIHKFYNTGAAFKLKEIINQTANASLEKRK